MPQRLFLASASWLLLPSSWQFANNILVGLYPALWTERQWVYDLRTNPLTRAHLDECVARYHAANRHQRQESERFRSFGYDELLKRDKLSLDLFWLRDESLEDVDDLPTPGALAASTVEDLQAALEQFMAIAEDLNGSMSNGGR